MFGSWHGKKSVLLQLHLLNIINMCKLWIEKLFIFFKRKSSNSIYWDASTVRQVCAYCDLDDTYVLESLKPGY